MHFEGKGDRGHQSPFSGLASAQFNILCSILFKKYFLDIGVFVEWGAHAKSLQSCLTLCNPIDCSPPGSSVHGILQARTLEWVAMPSSRGSSWPRDWICISYVLHWQADSLPLVPPGKPNQLCILYILEKPTIFPSASESSFSELSWCLRSPTMWGFPVNKWFSETPAGYPTS